MSIEPIIIIDDDIEDLELLKEIISGMHLPNLVLTFHNPVSALDFLKNTIIEPIFILCDINMPKLNGFQLRAELLDSESTIKEVPFLFLSTSKVQTEMALANELKVYAYYTKSSTIKGIEEMFGSIMVLLKVGPKN